MIYLRFIGTNSPFFNFEEIFGLNRRTVSEIVTEVTEAMLSLEEELIQFPSPEKCLEVAKEFEKIAKMPGIIGAVDGNRQYFFSLKRADFVEQKIMSRPIVKFFDWQ